MSLELDNISSGFNLSKINSNFQKVEEYVNDKLLARAETGVPGEAKMERDLDMDGNSILNIGVDTSNPDSLLTLEVADARYYNVDGDTLEGTMDANNNRIVSVGAPVASGDAIRKIDLDNEAAARQAGDASLQEQLNGTNPPMGSAFSVISWHGQHVTNSITIPDNVNAWSFGPEVEVDAGQSVTIGTGSFWTIAEGSSGIDSLELRVDALENDVSTLQTDVSSLDSQQTATSALANTTALELDALEVVVGGLSGGGLPHQLNTKSIYFFGDSITAAGLYIPTLHAISGTSTAGNGAIAGQGMQGVASQIASASIGSTPVILIWAGINDYRGDWPLGSIGDADASGAASNSFYYWTWKSINNALTANPSALVYLVSPMKADDKYWPENMKGLTLQQYVTAQEQVAALAGASFIDMYSKSQISLQNLSVFTVDHLHPNAAGGTRIGRILAYQLNAG